MIETLISAVILVIVVGAVLTTIDASGRTATVNKNRSVAATLAEKDQERMRAMSPIALDGHSQSPSVNVDGVTYTVNSKSEWMDDASDTPKNCESSNNQGSYMRITSTVTSSVLGTRVKPVTMRSIVAPRVGNFDEDTGTLAVRLSDHLGRPVQGIQVTITPAAALPRVTDEFGCAVFSHIPVRGYTATLDTGGYVNEDSRQKHEATADVVLNQTTSLAMTYARAAQVTVNFKGAAGASSAHAVTLANAKKRIVTEAPSSTMPSSLTVALFPYPEGYSAYTGRCTANSPAYESYMPANADYVATNPGFTLVTAGQLSVVDAFQPSANVRVMASSTTPATGARVVFTPTDTKCSPTAGITKFVRFTGDDGYLLDRGLPFGKYNVCAQRVVGSTTRRDPTVNGLDNSAPTGSASHTFTITSGDTSGACP